MYSNNLNIKFNVPVICYSDPLVPIVQQNGTHLPTFLSYLIMNNNQISFNNIFIAKNRSIICTFNKYIYTRCLNTILCMLWLLIGNIIYEM